MYSDNLSSKDLKWHVSWVTQWNLYEGGGGEIHEYMSETLKDFFFFFSPPACTLTACEESNCPLLVCHIWDTVCRSFLKLFQAFPFYPMTVAVSIHFSQPTFLKGDLGSVFLQALHGSSWRPSRGDSPNLCHWAFWLPCGGWCWDEWQSLTPLSCCCSLGKPFQSWVGEVVCLCSGCQWSAFPLSSKG